MTCEDVYKICQNHFAIAGIPLKLAKGTPLELSYIWKHIQRLTNKFVEWNFTIDEIDAYIKIVAHKLSMMPPKQRSIQNAIKNDMLEYCYSELKRQKDDIGNLVEQIERTHNWLISIAGADTHLQVSHLTKRHKPGSLPNIVLYFQQGRLSKQYIAFSGPCREALNVIGRQNTVERNFCPTDTALHFITQYKFKNLTPAIRKVIGD